MLTIILLGGLSLILVGFVLVVWAALHVGSRADDWLYGEDE